MGTATGRIPDDPLGLELQVCFALSVAARNVVAVYRPFPESMRLTHPQYLVMLALWQHGRLSVKRLSDLLQLDPGTLSPLVKRLEVAGLVHRDRDPRDERALAMALTDDARALRTRAEQIPPGIVERLDMDLAELVSLREAPDPRDRRVPTRPRGTGSRAGRPGRRSDGVTTAEPDGTPPAPVRRPGVLHWPWYALGGGLPERNRGRVLYDTTTRTWVLRHVVRSFVQLAVPIGLVLAFVPGEFCIRGMGSAGRDLPGAVLLDRLHAGDHGEPDQARGLPARDRHGDPRASGPGTRCGGQRKAPGRRRPAGRPVPRAARTLRDGGPGEA